MMPTSPARLIKAHTGLRGIAALLVVAYHLQYRTGHLAIEDATTFFARSYLMVDLFFILSGFIMAYVHPVVAGTSMSVGEMKSFWYRRAVRIYPLHFVVLIAMVSFAVLVSIYSRLGGPDNSAAWTPTAWRMLAAQFLLVNAWLGAPNSWNIPSWSISAEFVAYALFPWLVMLLSRMPRPAATLIVVAALAFYAVGPVGRSLDITGGIGAPLRCLAGFCLGLVLYTHRDWFARFGDRALSAAQIAALGWIAAAMMVPCHDSLVIPGFLTLVGLTWTDRGVVARALSGRRLLWLGEISYSIYIMHLFVLSVLAFGWDRSFRRLITDVGIERSVFIVVAYIAVILAAGLAHKWFEVSTRRWLMRRWAASVRSRAVSDHAAS